MNSVISDIIKKEKNIKYKLLSELKDEININIFKEEKYSDREININKTNSIYLNNKNLELVFIKTLIVLIMNIFIKEIIITL
jgi:hypothetical protein